MSLVLLGLCHGHHSNNRTVGTNVFIENSVLIEVEEQNKFGLPEVKTVQVKLSKKHMDQGIDKLWAQNKGKTVSIPVFVGAWASKAGNAGFDLWLAGDGKPMNVQHIKPVQAAS